jgi:hypothetical protein
MSFELVDLARAVRVCRTFFKTSVLLQQVTNALSFRRLEIEDVTYIFAYDSHMYTCLYMVQIRKALVNKQPARELDVWFAGQNVLADTLNRDILRHIDLTAGAVCSTTKRKQHEVSGVFWRMAVREADLRGLKTTVRDLESNTVKIVHGKDLNGLFVTTEWFDENQIVIS